MSKWYPLDNAAKLFSAVSKPNNTSVFRVSMIMKETVQPVLLQLALDQVIHRFPTMSVQIHRGVFWSFLSENQEQLLVEEEQEYPCFSIHAKLNHNYHFRILYFNRRIAIEVFHSLTDGAGAAEFLKSLVYQYLILCGKAISDDGLILLADDVADYSEKEDSYKKYYHPVKAKREKKQRAFRIVGTPITPFGNNVVNGLLDVEQLLVVARGYGTTITGYITAALIYAIYQEYMFYGSDKEQIKVTVPVNLRKTFPSSTLRNFFAVITVGMPLTESISFEVLLAEITQQLQSKTQKEHLNEVMSGNIKMEKLLAIRLVPAFIKNWAMQYGFEAYGEDLKTMSLSNIGNVQLPTSMQAYVEWMEVVLYPTQKSPINCGVCSVNNILTLSFSRTIEDIALIRGFFKFISEHDQLTARVYGNDWGNSHE